MLDRVLLAMWIAATLAEGARVPAQENQVAAKAVATNTHAADRSLSIIRCWSRRIIPAPGRRIPFPFQITHQRTIGPRSPFNIDVLLIDGNTGTQLDVPPHSVARPELKREKSGPLGLAYTDKIEAWQFGGEACVIDVRDLLDQAPNGVSPLVTAEHVERFEQQHRQLRFGDVVLFRSDYSDKYYRPLPDGQPVHRRRAGPQSAGFSRSRPGLHGVSGQARRDDARHRQRQHGPAARSGGADALCRPEVRHDLDRKRDESRRTAGDRRLLLHARPEARRRTLQRRAGLLDRRRRIAASG